MTYGIMTYSQFKMKAQDLNWILAFIEIENLAPTHSEKWHFGEWHSE
jgi:hypothetical protein